MVMRKILLAAALAAGWCVFLASAPAEDKDKDKDKDRDRDKAMLTDEQFVVKASASGLAEVSLGKMAAEQATNPAVKKFGQHMVNDHTKANMELLALADRKKFAPAQQMEKKHHDAALMLAKLQGAEFDRAFMAQMVTDHEMAVDLFRAEAESGKDQDLKAWAAKTLPTLKEHLQMARDLAGKGREDKKP